MGTEAEERFTLMFSATFQLPSLETRPCRRKAKSVKRLPLNESSFSFPAECNSKVYVSVQIGAAVPGKARKLLRTRFPVALIARHPSSRFSAQRKNCWSGKSGLANRPDRFFSTLQSSSLQLAHQARIIVAIALCGVALHRCPLTSVMGDTKLAAAGSC